MRGSTVNILFIKKYRTHTLFLSLFSLSQVGGGGRHGAEAAGDAEAATAGDEEDDDEDGDGEVVGGG